MGSIGINGTITLFLSNVLGKFFGAVYRLPLSNLLGASGMGLYQMAFPIYSFLLTFLTGGISITLTRKISNLRATKDYVSIRKNYKLAKNISLFLGIVFFLFLIVFAFPLSITQGNANAVYGYLGISLGFIFACLLGAYRGYYQGFNNMLPTAISGIIEQLGKLVFGLLFATILIKQGIVYGVMGACLGVSFSEFLSFLYFKMIMRKQKNVKVNLKKSDYIAFSKEIMPVSISYGIIPLGNLIDSFLVINLLTLSGFQTFYSTSLYGVQTGMILPLINMPNVLVSAMALAIIPSLSFKKAQGKAIGKNISKVLWVAYIFILPCAVGLFLLSDNIIALIYPNLSIEFVKIASLLLRYSCFEMFFLCFVTITNAILQALGKTKQPIFSLGVGILIKIILTITLVSNQNLNIYGLAISGSFGYFVAALVNVVKIKKLSGFRFTFKQTTLPLIASTIMATILLFYLNFAIGGIFGLFAIIAICIAVYFCMLWIFRQVTFKEIKKLLQKEAL